MEFKSTTYTAKDGDRLDSIVYRHYGTLEPLEAVATANPKLSVLLHTGDQVYLPEMEIKPREARLW